MMAETYAQKLEEAGFDVERHETMSVDYAKRVRSLEGIDVFPRYIPEWEDLENPKPAKELLSMTGFAQLEKTDFANEWVLVAPEKTAQKFDLEDASDFVNVPDYDIHNGKVYDKDDPMKRFYKYMEDNHEPDFSDTDDDRNLGYRDKDGILLISTRADILVEDFKVLKDTEDLIESVPYSLAPMLRESVANEYPEAREALDEVSRELTIEDLRRLNRSHAYEDGDDEDINAAVERYAP